MRRLHFVSTDALAELDAIGQRYHIAPSAQLGITDPLEAFQINQAAAIVGQAREKQALDKAAPADPAARPMKRASTNARGGATLVFPSGKIPIIRKPKPPEE